mgnify:CR=1 FL=1
MQPHAPELEEAVIGACLIEQEALPLIADKLRPEMFYDDHHQLIFAALMAMYHAGKKIDILTVKEELARRGNLDAIGGPYAIVQLSSKVASSAHIEYHAQIIHQKYLAREMVVGFNKLLTCAMDETIDIDDTLIDAHNLLDRLEGESGHNAHIRDMETLMADTMEEAERRIAKSVNGVTGIPTGLTELDKKTGGLQDNDLIVIAARPSVGKTAFALHLARHAALAGNAVAVYSLEMQGERLGDRWLMAACNINPYRWRNGIPNPQEVAEARTTASGLAQLPIYVDDSSSVSMDHIRSSARLLKSRKQCDMIIIDYLQLCDMSTKQVNRNREQEVAQATRKAKLLAKELHIPVVLLSQLNRESENRPGGRPELAHLRESGAIEQDADVIMMLYRPAAYPDTQEAMDGDNTSYINVAKHRNGATASIKVMWVPELTKYANYAPDPD